MSKDAGYKIVAHMMPDLPNCGSERDIWQFQEFFENPAFRSDGLKLYPTLVIRGTGSLHWKKYAKLQDYTSSGARANTKTTHRTPWSTSSRGLWPWYPRGPGSTESNGTSLLAYPAHFSDIPMPLVSSGVENGNLRELALARMKDFGAECRDVRYREVGVSDMRELC